MKTRWKAGFSLMEVNMAIFVMAVGILSVVALFPLGLRESTQGQADITQAMFSDYLLNQAVAAASLTNFWWSEWKKVPNAVDRDHVDLLDTLPDFMRQRMHLPKMDPPLSKASSYSIACCLVPGASDKIMGIMVQSTEVENGNVAEYTNNPVYYAEVLFQGDPTK